MTGQDQLGLFKADHRKFAELFSEFTVTEGPQKAGASRKGHEESTRAHEHSTQAHRHSADAHGKSGEARTKR